MKAVDEIEKYVYGNEQDRHCNNVPPRIKCLFKIYAFDNRFMASVTTTDPRQGIKRSDDFTGNSLWSLGALPFSVLKDKINLYNGLNEIKKDFDC